WIDDAAEGLTAIALGDETGVFDLGTGVSISAGDVARLALAAAGEQGRPVVSDISAGGGGGIIALANAPRRARVGVAPEGDGRVSGCPRRPGASREGPCMKRVIAVFTGNRAEYGLQYPILRAIAANDRLDYRLIVSGAHLDPQFGRTLDEIRADGITVHAEVKIDMEADTLTATARAIGSGVVSMSQALEKIRPDMLVVYADRFEGFAAIIAGTQMNVPTAHVEGGDLTEGGALDDSVRHAMTKLAHLHFTTNAQATNRILAMGEEPWRVH